jgi:sigma-E factor negative regulatory protein RseC
MKALRLIIPGRSFVIKEQGIIQEIKRHKATVRIQQTSACAQCQSRASCDVSKRDMLIEVSNDLHAKEGDCVEISVPEGTVLKLSLLIYIMPIVALIFGAFLGAAIAPPLQVNATAASILGGGCSMGMVYVVLRQLNKKAESSNRYFPQMIRIVASAEPFSKPPVKGLPL